MVLVVLEEVEHAESQHVKCEAYVATKVEPVQHLNTDTEGGGEGGTVTWARVCQLPLSRYTNASDQPRMQHPLCGNWHQFSGYLPNF